jgi:hypothetical protein
VPAILYHFAYGGEAQSFTVVSGSIKMTEYLALWIETADAAIVGSYPERPLMVAQQAPHGRIKITRLLFATQIADKPPVALVKSAKPVERPYPYITVTIFAANANEVGTHRVWVGRVMPVVCDIIAGQHVQSRIPTAHPQSVSAVSEQSTYLSRTDRMLRLTIGSQDIKPVAFGTYV